MCILAYSRISIPAKRNIHSVMTDGCLKGQKLKIHIIHFLDYWIKNAHLGV